jgi:uncharacterized Zn finger protein (UPF0148 family)
MRREVLIRRIAQELVARRLPHEKLAELSAYWGWDEVSPGWQRLPVRVREEMLRREDAVPRIWRSLYDAFFEFVEEDARRIVRNEALKAEAEELGLSVDTVEGTPDAAEPCPCCGYRTFEWRGEHDVCPVCGWEDEDGEDALDDGPEQLQRFSMAHQMTRAEYRRAYEAMRDVDLRAGDPERLSKYGRFATAESRPRLIPRGD